MESTIDAAGRIVIPKPIREALGLLGGDAVDIRVEATSIVLSAPSVPKRAERHAGRVRIVADADMPPLTTEQVRATLESVRR